MMNNAQAQSNRLMSEMENKKGAKKTQRESMEK
jgi:hypothetical protein